MLLLFFVLLRVRKAPRLFNRKVAFLEIQETRVLSQGLKDLIKHAPSSLLLQSKQK